MDTGRSDRGIAGAFGRGCRKVSGKGIGRASGKNVGRASGRKRRLPSAAAFPAVFLGTIFITWLYYGRLPGLIPGALGGLYIGVVVDRAAEKRRQRKRRENFRRLLLSLETALEAGYSLENTLEIAEGDLTLVYGSGNEIVRYVTEIRQKTGIGTPVWKAFQEYAEEVEIEEAQEFAQVLRIQQRTGGDLIRTVRKAAERLQQSLGLQQEIETTLSEKQLEQRIMTLMPSVMLLYMRLMNGAYMAPLYTGLGGAIVMSIALAANIGADLLADRMLGKALGRR